MINAATFYWYFSYPLPAEAIARASWSLLTRPNRKPAARLPRRLFSWPLEPLPRT